MCSRAFNTDCMFLAVVPQQAAGMTCLRSEHVRAFVLVITARHLTARCVCYTGSGPVRGRAAAAADRAQRPLGGGRAGGRRARRSGCRWRRPRKRPWRRRRWQWRRRSPCFRPGEPGEQAGSCMIPLCSMRHKYTVRRLAATGPVSCQ